MKELKRLKAKKKKLKAKRKATDKAIRNVQKQIDEMEYEKNRIGFKQGGL